MPSVTFLLAIDVPEVSPEALSMEANDILDDLTSASHNVLSCVPWARPNNPVVSPAGGFTTLGGNPPPAPTA